MTEFTEIETEQQTLKISYIGFLQAIYLYVYEYASFAYSLQALVSSYKKVKQKIFSLIIMF